MKVLMAIRALEETAPNARDYYPFGDLSGRYRQAQLQHEQREMRLRDVQAELIALTVAVEERRDNAEIE